MGDAKNWKVSLHDGRRAMAKHSHAIISLRAAKVDALLGWKRKTPVLLHFQLIDFPPTQWATAERLASDWPHACSHSRHPHHRGRVVRPSPAGGGVGPHATGPSLPRPSSRAHGRGGLPVHVCSC